MKYIILSVFTLSLLTGCASNKVFVDQRSCVVRYTLVNGHIIQECDQVDPIK